MSPSPPTPHPPRAPTRPAVGAPGRERWLAGGLLGAALLGLLLLWTSGVLSGGAEEGPGEATPWAETPDASFLRPGEPRARPVPADVVEVLVVLRDGGQPVGETAVRLRSALSGAPGAGDLGLTDAEGRVRLTGEFPAFVEVSSEAYLAEPAILAVEGGTRVRFEVVPRAPYRATLLDATTGLPLAGWRLCPAGLPPDLVPTVTDGQGHVAWPGLARAPTLVAASDGSARVHSFLLHEVPGRLEVRLAMPPAGRRTRLRVVDVVGAPVAGARAFVLTEGTGVGIELDAGGEADVEYGLRDGVGLVVLAPGHVRRAIVLDGRAEETVVLEGSAPRRVRVLRPDGVEAPDGTRVRGWTQGPSSYGAQGAGLDVEGVVVAGVATLPDLPVGPFDATLLLRGESVYAWLQVAMGPDPTAVVEVRAGPPRSFELRVGRGAFDEGALPATGLVWVQAPCAVPGARAAEGGADRLGAALAAGRPDEALATISAHAGPTIRLDMPTSAEPRAILLATPRGEQACLEIGPEDAEGPRDVRLVPGHGVEAPRPTVLLVEWEDGVPAALVELEVASDRDAPPVASVQTDSSGVGFLAASAGRFTFTTSRADGTRFASDAPLLLPAPGSALVRLRAVGP